MLDNRAALVLNADFRPLSYFPLSLWSWRDAVKAVFLEKVNVLAEYDDAPVRSPTFDMHAPSVISLKEYIAPAKRPAFTRFNVFLRDQFCCSYCGVKAVTSELTFDHVIPRSRGGRTDWANVATACGACNLAKANLTPKEAHMPLRHTPTEPTVYELQARGQAFPPNFLHESWRDYLYWDSVLESD